MPAKAELKAFFAGPDNPYHGASMLVWSGELKDPSSAWTVNSAKGNESAFPLDARNLWGFAVRAKR